MIFFSDPRLRRKELGRVADYCRICHSLRPFRFLRVEKVAELLFPMKSSHFVGYEIHCEVCATALGTKRRRYAALSESMDAGIEALLAETNPKLVNMRSTVAALRKRIDSGMLRGDERLQLLRESLLVLEPMLEDQLRTRRLSPVGRAVAWFTFGWVAPLSLATRGSALHSAAMVFFCLGLFATIYLLLTRKRSFIRRVLKPTLIRAFAPLEPSLDEIETALREPPTAIARELTVEQVYAWVREAQERARLQPEGV